MKEHFKDKFKSRTKEELLAIINDRENYQLVAVDAALELLEEDHEFNPDELEKATTHIEHPPRYVKKSKHLKPPYFRTFSSREVWSSLSASAGFLAVIWIYRELNTGEVNDWVLIPSLFTLFLLSNVLNHVFYVKEHRRSLSFLAGLFQLGLTTTWLFILIVGGSLVNPDPILTFEDFLPFYLIMLMLASITEAFTQLIKAIFTVFKWRTW